MIVDTSAPIAILAAESERAAFTEAILHANQAAMSAANYLETAIVIDRYNEPALSRLLDKLVGQLRIAVVDVTAATAQLARQAYRDYGRGSGHPAQLNFGDCFAYAQAKSIGEPLLFKGNDFVHTDVRSAA